MAYSNFDWSHSCKFTSEIFVSRIMFRSTYFWHAMSRANLFSTYIGMTVHTVGVTAKPGSQTAPLTAQTQLFLFDFGQL